jgi:LVIVD repeat-containing protein
MRPRLVLVTVLFACAFSVQAAPALAVHDGDPDSLAMTKLFNSQNATNAVNSDLAFWGNRAYAGNYNSFRIFDIANPATPLLLSDFPCDGPQQDPIVWKNKLLFTAVDSVMESPECGAARVPLAGGQFEQRGWEGVRIFDVSDPTAPKLIKGVYTDCGAHTITLYPKNPAQLMIYVSSYPLRAGPSCGPRTGSTPLHEKISVIRVPVHNPAAAKVVAQPKISYPGDPDNQFDPQEHGFPEADAFGNTFNNLTACHDIGVFVELRLAAAACAEQAQLWRIKRNGIPDTEHPLWVYDDNTDTDGPGGGDVAVDFWHSATFSWDGKVVNFIDESFGTGCPTRTTWSNGTTNDTGAMFFLNTRTGAKYSHFTLPRPSPDGYCSAHLGNVVRTADRYLLVNAWYEAGVDVIDFTNPRSPAEVAFWDVFSDNWSAYWYEGPSLPGDTLTLYGNDGVEDPATGEGFQVFSAGIDVDEAPLRYLNPQTQVRRIGSPHKHGKGHRARKASLMPAAARRPAAPRDASHLAP